MRGGGTPWTACVSAFATMRGTDYALELFEAAQRKGKRAEAPYLAALFPEQRAFVLDPAKRKTALCGRRAGKTEAVAAWLLDGAERKPGETCAYIALSQKQARRILWQTLRRVTGRHQIPITFHEQTLMATLENGSRIWITGCDNQGQADDFRGDRYYRVAIDEAGSFPDWLAYLVNDALNPALMDLDGELAMVGTPGLVPVGFFYERSAGEHPWPTHHWTSLDNPYVPGEKYLNEQRGENGWDTNHPTYVREYLGQWVRDDEARIYPFEPSRNTGTAPPLGERGWLRVLSVDLGYDDPCAFTLSVSLQGHPEVYFERAWTERKLTPAHISGKIQQLRAEQKIHRIVIDEGGLGKSISEGFRNDGIPCEPAEKSKKLAAIHEVRGALLAGTLRIDPQSCRGLRDEWLTVPWNEKRDDHHESFRDDLCDSALYGWRAHRSFYRPEHEAPAVGSPEWHEAERKRQYEKARAEVLKKQRRQGWRGASR